MPTIAGIEKKIRESPKNVRFDDLARLCAHYFGDPRNSNGGSHRTYKTPWQGDPRVNIQDKHGRAKPYQVAQVLAAIDRKKDFGDAGK